MSGSVSITRAGRTKVFLLEFSTAYDQVDCGSFPLRMLGFITALHDWLLRPGSERGLLLGLYQPAVGKPENS